jgi:hypothetical protein
MVCMRSGDGWVASARTARKQLRLHLGNVPLVHIEGELHGSSVPSRGPQRIQVVSIRQVVISVSGVEGRSSSVAGRKPPLVVPRLRIRDMAVACSGDLSPSLARASALAGRRRARLLHRR